MRTVIPLLGAGIVGLAVGALIALAAGRSLVRGALWGSVGGLAFGAGAAVVLVIAA